MALLASLSLIETKTCAIYNDNNKNVDRIFRREEEEEKERETLTSKRGRVREGDEQIKSRSA